MEALEDCDLWGCAVVAIVIAIVVDIVTYLKGKTTEDVKVCGGGEETSSLELLIICIDMKMVGIGIVVCAGNDVIFRMVFISQHVNLTAHPSLHWH